MFKQVNIARVNTMADGGIRVTIDLLDGDEEDIKNAFSLMKQETSMILCPTNNLIEQMQEVAAALH